MKPQLTICTTNAIGALRSGKPFKVPPDPDSNTYLIKEFLLLNGIESKQLNAS